jgi:hypothetical protein
MKVRANRVCFVDNGLRQEGDVFEYNGPPNGCVDPIDAPKPAEPASADGDTVAKAPAPRLRRKAAPSAD